MTRRAMIAAACLLGAPAAMAQGDYPGGKVVTIVVPFAAGGTTDLLGRILAERLGARLNGKFIVENRPGPAAIPASRPSRARRPTATR
jgi:tripartite-type tricarboxylate transporter receptor subunit TctC